MTAYQLYSNPRSLARLAGGSAVTIATILSLPDAIASASTLSDAVVWLIRLCGQWLTVGILWSSGFFVALLLARLTGGPILISPPQGIKVWRFGKLLPWDAIVSVSVSEHDRFARLFFLRRPVYRLTVYLRTGTHLASPLVVPSFLFSLPEFEALVVYVCSSACGFIPDAPQFALFAAQEQERLRTLHARANVMRIALSIFVSLSLAGFLCRKTGVACEYNLGMRELHSGNYASAIFHLRSATKTDPSFAMDWDKLGWAQKRLHHDEEAASAWRTALLYKPDLVESKVALAEVEMEAGNLESAQRLLTQAVRLAPDQAAAYLDLAKLFGRKDDLAPVEKMVDAAGRSASRNNRSCMERAALYAQYGLIDKAQMLARLAEKGEQADLPAR